MGEALKALAPVACSWHGKQGPLLYDWKNRWALEDARFVTPDKGYEKTGDRPPRRV